MHFPGFGIFPHDQLRSECLPEFFDGQHFLGCAHGLHPAL